MQEGNKKETSYVSTISSTRTQPTTKCHCPPQVSETNVRDAYSEPATTKRWLRKLSENRQLKIGSNYNKVKLAGKVSYTKLHK